MNHFPLVPAALLALSAAALPAQQTWIVDESGGPGAQFTEIGAAVAAASPGDLILIRPGSYSAFRVDKSLRILGATGVIVSGGFGVSGLPAGEALTLRDLELTLGHPAIHIGLQLAQNQGRVHLDGIRVTSTLTPNDAVIRDCALVSLSRCDITGLVGLEIDRSAVHVDGSSLRSSGGITSNPGIALRCADSQVDIGTSTVAGANQVFVALASSAIDLRSGTLILGEETTVRAGTGGATPLPAIVTSGGALVADPGVAILPSNGAPAVTGPAQVQARVVPAVTTSGTVGGTFAGQAFAPVASVQTTFLNVASSPVATPFGPLWVALPLLIADVGAVPPSGVRAFSFTVPAAVPAGIALTTQSITLHAGALYLGTPSTAVFAAAR